MINKFDNYTENQLISLWQQGNEQAFARLHANYLILLTAIAFNKTGNRAVAEELVQETFIALYKHKSAIKESTSIKAYLYVILKNKIIDYYRSESLKQRYANCTVKQTSSATMSPSVYVETKELEQILKEAINKLPARCKQVFRLSRENNLTDKEIAYEMDISVKTVEQHKGKALRILRSALKGAVELSVIYYLFNW